MNTDRLSLSAADALLYLCAARCGRARLNRALIAVTALAGVMAGLISLLGV